MRDHLEKHDLALDRPLGGADSRQLAQQHGDDVEAEFDDLLRGVGQVLVDEDQNGGQQCMAVLLVLLPLDALCEELDQIALDLCPW